MFGVTIFTGACFGNIAASMKTGGFCDVLSDLFMTIETELYLKALSKAGMAKLTVVLVFGMALNNLARHDDMLNGFLFGLIGLFLGNILLFGSRADAREPERARKEQQDEENCFWKISG
jgi:hypothetical protein